MSGQKKRADNFTAFETDVLLTIIGSYKDIINSKKIDRKSSEEKSNIWKKVEMEFYEQVGTHRDHNSLKKKYENWKKAMKKTCVPDVYQQCTAAIKMQLDSEPQSPAIAGTVDSGIPDILQAESMALSKLEMEKRFLEEEHELRMKKLKLEMDNLQRESELRQEKLRLEIEILRRSQKSNG